MNYASRRRTRGTRKRYRNSLLRGARINRVTRVAQQILSPGLIDKTRPDGVSWIFIRLRVLRKKKEE